ncbi:hypothetical protein ARMGADRAFT_1029979 [Armillaria gallica]|uniref:Uncharacterized protein n=1 Tax=Armillaria gallica TaxID=47427 RepID=A0A2H3E0U2_ARMGA|nr:hypothetical protein ARMGADRAFT_1029979 [Armillaria gallica]
MSAIARAYKIHAESHGTVAPRISGTVPEISPHRDAGVYTSIPEESYNSSTDILIFGMSCSASSQCIAILPTTTPEIAANTPPTALVPPRAAFDDDAERARHAGRVVVVVELVRDELEEEEIDVTLNNSDVIMDARVQKLWARVSAVGSSFGNGGTTQSVKYPFRFGSLADSVELALRLPLLLELVLLLVVELELGVVLFLFVVLVALPAVIVVVVEGPGPGRRLRNRAKRQKEH